VPNSFCKASARSLTAISLLSFSHASVWGSWRCPDQLMVVPQRFSPSVATLAVRTGLSVRLTHAPNLAQRRCWYQVGTREPLLHFCGTQAIIKSCFAAVETLSFEISVSPGHKIIRSPNGETSMRLDQAALSCSMRRHIQCDFLEYRLPVGLLIYLGLQI
jgi:hypothetical protein